MEVERAVPQLAVKAYFPYSFKFWLAKARQILKNQKTLFWAAIGYLGLTAVFTYPLVFSFSKALPGQLLEDRDQNLWNLWWVPQALLNLKNPFHTDYIYYPGGVSLYFHTLHPLNGLISFPVQFLFGLTSAYNFVVFFSFVVAGMGTYLLFVYLCGNKTAAFAASLIFVFAPYHLGTLKGLMQLISLEWLPFYILFLLRATHPESLFSDSKRKGLDIGLAVFFLVCTALTDWYYVLFLLIFTALYLIYPFEVFKTARQDYQKRPFWLIFKRRLFNTSLIFGLFGLLMSPVLVPMLRELSQKTYYLPTENAAQGFSASLAAFFVPPTTLTLLGGFGQNFRAEYLTGPLAAQVYLGYVALLLGIIGLVVNRGSRFWGVIFGVFWVLALGPALHLNGADPGWAMPFALIQNWPIIKITRSPDRFIVISMLALGVCASYGITWLAKRLRPVKKMEWVGALAGLLIVLEFLQIPYPTNKLDVPPFFSELVRDPADFSIFELPAQGGFWSGAPRMAYQTVHHKRIFDGYISREYDHPFVRRTPGFAELTLLKMQPDVFLAQKSLGDSSGDRAWNDAFSYFKVRYLALYLPQTDKQRVTTDLALNRSFISKVVSGPPVYRDDLVEIYPLPQQKEEERRPFGQIGEGWYDAEPNELGGGKHRWAEGQSNLNLYWQGPGERTSNVKFNIGLLKGDGQMRITLDNAAVWEGKVEAARQTIQLSLKLRPGEHRLDFYPSGEAKTPKSLGMGNDPRKLNFYISDLSVD